MNRKKQLIIIGGKGNGTLVAATVEDMIEAGADWEIMGFLDDKYSPDKALSFQGYPVLGRVDDAMRFMADSCYFYYGLFSAKNSIRMAQKLQDLGIPDNKFATLIHPTAKICRGVRFGYGVCVMAQSFIGPEAVLGNHILIHGQTYIARNTILEDYAYLAPQAYLGAEATIRKGAYLGAASTVIERVTIGAWSVVGIGANVLCDVSEDNLVVGNPAMVKRVLTEQLKEQLKEHSSDMVGLI